MENNLPEAGKKSRVDELTEKLAEAVVESEEYQTYLKHYMDVKTNPQLYREVNEIRKMAFELQNSDSPDYYEEVLKISERTQHIFKNNAAVAFIRSELALCRMVQYIQRTVLEGIDIDLDFLEQ